MTAAVAQGVLNTEQPTTEEIAAGFATLYRGSPHGHGRTNVTVDSGGQPVRDARGKTEYSSWVEKRGATKTDFLAHLMGERRIGAIPQQADGTTWFAVIDVDDYGSAPLHHVRAHVASWPHVMFKSKSGGLHITVFFSEPVSVEEVRAKLTPVAAMLPKCREVFPKQATTTAEEPGNFINLPLFGGLLKASRRECPYYDPEKKEWSVGVVALLRDVPRLTREQFLLLPVSAPTVAASRRAGAAQSARARVVRQNFDVGRNQDIMQMLTGYAHIGVNDAVLRRLGEQQAKACLLPNEEVEAMGKHLDRVRADCDQELPPSEYTGCVRYEGKLAEVDEDKFALIHETGAEFMVGTITQLSQWAQVRVAHINALKTPPMCNTKKRAAAWVQEVDALLLAAEVRPQAECRSDVLRRFAVAYMASYCVAERPDDPRYGPVFRIKDGRAVAVAVDMEALMMWMIRRHQRDNRQQMEAVLAKLMAANRVEAIDGVAAVYEMPVPEELITSEGRARDEHIRDVVVASIELAARNYAVIY